LHGKNKGITFAQSYDKRNDKKHKMKPYNLKNLSDGLQEQAQYIKGQDIINIAAAERISTSTVREYLKGNITTPAIGKAILDRCRAIGIAKNAA
jgi:hypothetical protein